MEYRLPRMAVSRSQSERSGVHTSLPALSTCRYLMLLARKQSKNERNSGIGFHNVGTKGGRSRSPAKFRKSQIRQFADLNEEICGFAICGLITTLQIFGFAMAKWAKNLKDFRTNKKIYVPSFGGTYRPTAYLKGLYHSWALAVPNPWFALDWTERWR